MERKTQLKSELLHLIADLRQMLMRARNLHAVTTCPSLQSVPTRVLIDSNDYLCALFRKHLGLKVSNEDNVQTIIILYMINLIEIERAKVEMNQARLV